MSLDPVRLGQDISRLMRFLVLAFIGALFLPMQVRALPLEPGGLRASGGGVFPSAHTDCVHCTDRAKLDALSAKSAEKSELLGGTAPPAGMRKLRFFPQGGTLWSDLGPGNFVDVDPTTTARDYNNGPYTYEGHTGIDSALVTFTEQDIGVPVFAALDGTVILTHDGEADRNTAWAGQQANYVALDHGGGHITTYYHLRKNSVSVNVGQIIKAGTQIGMTASSGNSTSPHLHFESRVNGASIETFTGAGNPGESGWVSQPAFRGEMYLRNFVLTTDDLTAWAGPPGDTTRTGTLGTGSQGHYFWFSAMSVPAGTTYRLRYLRPDGSVRYDSTTRQLTSPTAGLSRSGWFWVNYIIDFDVQGAWTVEVTMNGNVVTNAPLLISNAPKINRAPSAITATLDPVAPAAADVIFCRVPLRLIGDSDYDLVRYRYEWRRNGSVVRDITSAGLADAIPADTCVNGDTLTCTVTPSDGTLSGVSALVSVIVGATPPTVITQAASSVGKNSAQLAGTVDANTLVSTALFEYGTTTAYGSFIAATPSTITGDTPQSVSATLIGLIGATTYHYRLTSTNADGTGTGADMSFTTQSDAEISLAQLGGGALTDGGASVSATATGFGSTSAPMVFTISNSGTSALAGIAISKDGANAADFTVLSPGATTIAAGGSTTFSVLFSPGAIGTRSAALHIFSNDGDESPFDIALTGTGLDPTARIISPAGGATLTSATTLFTWDAGIGVTSYALWIGSAPGAYDLYSGNEGTNLAKSVTLPADGRALYLTLHSLVQGSYLSRAHTFTAWRSPQPVKARLISPANGSALTSTSLPLVWDAGVGVTSCYLQAGTALGGYDLCNNNEGTNTQRTITVPAGGAQVHVTLWSLINGAYQNNRYVFTTVASEKAALISPANGATLTGGTLSLSWSAGTGVSRYYLFLGSSYGGYDLGAVDAGAATTSGLTVPQDGGPVYLTLWSLINGGFQAEHYWFTTALPLSGNRPARITSPANTSTLTASTMNLTWDTGAGATMHALWVGSAPNGFDLYAGIETTQARTLIVPGDGRRVHVTLHSLIGGAWQSNSYWFTAPTLPDGGAAQITSPAIGSTLASTSLPLTWSASAGATQYYLFVGTTPGAYDIHIGNEGANLTRTLTVPADGRPVYVTLYSLLNASWRQSSAWFLTANTAVGSKPALITSHANGATLPGAMNTFNWAGGVGVTQYALWIGSSPGAYDLWASADALSTSRTVTLPTDGRKIHLTLWSLIGGAYQGASYLFTAASIAPVKAVITAPVSGSTFTSASQTFTWNAGVGVTSYALWIGRTPGGYDIHASAEGTAQSRLVTTLPADGSPVYVTLHSLINGAWQSSEHVFNAWLQ